MISMDWNGHWKKYYWRFWNNFSSLFKTTQGLQTKLLPERRSIFCHISLSSLPLSSCFVVSWKTLQWLHANPSSALLPGLIEIAEELSRIPEWQRWSSASVFWGRNAKWEFGKPFKKFGCVLLLLFSQSPRTTSHLSCIFSLKSAIYRRSSCLWRRKLVERWLSKGLLPQLGSGVWCWLWL